MEKTYCPEMFEEVKSYKIVAIFPVHGGCSDDTRMYLYLALVSLSIFPAAVLFQVLIISYFRYVWYSNRPSSPHSSLHPLLLLKIPYIFLSTYSPKSTALIILLYKLTPKFQCPPPVNQCKVQIQLHSNTLAIWLQITFLVLSPEFCAHFHQTGQLHFQQTKVCKVQ